MTASSIQVSFVWHQHNRNVDNVKNKKKRNWSQDVNSMIPHVNMRCKRILNVDRMRIHCPTKGEYCMLKQFTQSPAISMCMYVCICVRALHVPCCLCAHSAHTMVACVHKADLLFIRCALNQGGSVNAFTHIHIHPIHTVLYLLRNFRTHTRLTCPV